MYSTLALLSQNLKISFVVSWERGWWWGGELGDGCKWQTTGEITTEINQHCWLGTFCVDCSCHVHSTVLLSPCTILYYNCVLKAEILGNTPFFSFLFYLIYDCPCPNSFIVNFFAIILPQYKQKIFLALRCRRYSLDDFLFVQSKHLVQIAVFANANSASLW